MSDLTFIIVDVHTYVNFDVCDDRAHSWAKMDLDYQQNTQLAAINTRKMSSYYVEMIGDVSRIRQLRDTRPIRIA